MDIYTSIVFATIAFLFVMVCDIATSRITSKKLKKNGILVCCVIAVATLCEWGGVKTDGVDVSYTWLHKVFKLLEFSIAPFIGVMAAFSFGKVEHPKIAVGIFIAHALLEVVMLHFGLIISIDSENVYHRGSLYVIYALFFCASIIYCFVSLVRAELMHYNRIDALLFATLIFLFLGVGVQMIWSEARIDYLCSAAGGYFLYNHRCKTILQLDGLTFLLNRRCFEKDAEKLKSPAVIISMDVNDFKALNDTYGHCEGDKYLKELADVIRGVYGKYGFCYRYGGDEFCVILKRRTDDIEALNGEFGKALEEMKGKVKGFTDVAVGYARFDENAFDVKSSIEKADEMMYKAKKLNKGKNDRSERGKEEE